MDNASYTAVTRQMGLLREMQAVANNIANLSTTGFRREAVIFSEYVHGMQDRTPSLSMANASGRHTDLSQGALTQTGGRFDLAIEGPGFFQIETPDGPALTRAGAFSPNEAGELVTPDGYRVLDNGGAPVFAPPDALAISFAADGTMSADGVPQAQIGLFEPANPQAIQHRSGVMFTAEGGFVPVDAGRVMQGFVENSNVNAVSEITRMIEVQRAYELGQKLLDQEHQRIRDVIQTLNR